MRRSILLLSVFSLSTVAFSANEPAFPVEFDKKAGLNPSCPAPRQIQATGTFLLPPGETLLYVDLAIAKRGRPAEPRRIVKATVDKAKPNTWSVLAKDLDDWSEFEVEARLYTRNAKGQELIHDSRDIRRVSMK